MDNNKYIDISKAFGSSLVEKACASTAFNSFVPINEVAKIKGLKSNRSIRIAIQKGKYIANNFPRYCPLFPLYYIPVQSSVVKANANVSCLT